MRIMYKISILIMINFLFSITNLKSFWFLVLQNDCEYDPIAELLKFAFKLKVDMGLHTQAKKLENLVDELIDNKSDTDSVICSTLVLLNELKETQYEDEKNLVIIYSLR